MARKKTEFQWVVIPPPTVEPEAAETEGEEEDGGRPIRSEHRAYMMDIRALVNRLAAMSKTARRALPLNDEIQGLLDGIAEAGASPHRRRLVMRARLLLLGEVDMVQLESALAGNTPAAARERKLVGWRTRILEGDDSVLQSFVEEFPTADRQALRTCAREARGEGQSAKNANKRLYKLLRDAVLSTEANSEGDSNVMGPKLPAR